jgi:hypothetical protein
LPEGRSVHVTVRDGREQIVLVSVRVEGAAGRLHPQKLAAGDCVFKELPPGTVTFVAEFGGARFELQHDTGTADAVLRVPAPARVVVAPPAVWPAPEPGWWLRALATPLDSPGSPSNPAASGTGPRNGPPSTCSTPPSSGSS